MYREANTAPRAWRRKHLERLIMIASNIKYVLGLNKVVTCNINPETWVQGLNLGPLGKQGYISCQKSLSLIHLKPLWLNMCMKLRC